MVMPTARLINGPGDGDILEIPEVVQDIRIPDKRADATNMDWALQGGEGPVVGSMEVHIYRLGRDPEDGHAHRDNRGRYLYWHQR